MVTTTQLAARRAAELQEVRRNPPVTAPWPKWDFIVGRKDVEKGRAARAAEAMRARRAELIARPLDCIWHELAVAALEVE